MQRGGVSNGFFETCLIPKKGVMTVMFLKQTSADTHVDFEKQPSPEPRQIW
jgi:hypothetical protein